jgi:Tol biopolymer transport system component
MIGKTFSHYKILEKLGEGGMGVVYKAEDTKLKRTVALKFLPPDLTRDPEAKERFIREARAASALDHNNICNIHEIDATDEGQTFMVMACYEGESLDEIISRGPLKVADAVEIASQIAQGLSKAHEKDIIHRDIKPANIFVTQDGVVKILDFGLAKLAGQAQLTKDSSTLGTVAYMSPEQLSGKEVDQRTDIWSLGVVLYEMLTGARPFKGDYEQAMIYSMLNEEPELVTNLCPGLPMDMAGIVAKTMAKNPGDRYQNAAKVSADLQSLGQAPIWDSKEEISQVKKRNTLWIILVIVILAGLFITGYQLLQKERTEFQIIRTVPLTTAPGLEHDPAWSPEGTRIAYASDERGNMDIWVKQVEAGQKINLTKDHSGYDGKPAWSPDGEWIAFISERNGGGIFILPALGGIPKQVCALSFAISQSRTGSIPDISWSPDGSTLAYAAEGSLFTISSSGSTPTILPLPPEGLIVGYLKPAWSPDGERIACTGLVAEGVSTSQIWSFDRIKDDPIPVTNGIHMDHSPVWAPSGKYIFFISDRGGTNDVWYLPVDRRGSPIDQAEHLTTGVGVSAIALSKDGTKLCYVKNVDRSNIWTAPIVTNRLIKLADARQLTTENHYIERLNLSPDGLWCTFDSNRRGNMDIWIMRKDGNALRQLTTNQAHDWTPRWSPDGKKIVFHSLRSGNRDLFVIPAVGGALAQLTNHPAEDIAGNWSPNGEFIGFVSNRSGNMDLWLMPSSGGEPKQLTFNKAPDFLPEWAPDGKQIAFSTNRTGNYELFLIPEENLLNPDKRAEPSQLTHGNLKIINACCWTMDGKTIYAYGLGRHLNQRANFWTVSLENGTTKPVLDLGDSMMEPLNSLVTDGQRIYFPLWERIGDLWIAELENIKE